MTPLEARLVDQIRRDGPLRFDVFMQQALYDPEHGFYSGKESAVRTGQEGDFATAPTLTPVFASAFARFVLQAWKRLGEPLDWLLVEPGGGTGELLAGIVKRLEEMDSEAMRGLRVVLVDASPAHRKKAEKALSKVLRKARLEVTSGLPAFDAPAVVVANELLDNLPVRLLRFEDDAWWERVVAVDDEGRLCFGRSEAPQEWVDWVASFQVPVPERQQVEIPVGADEWLGELTKQCGRHPVVMALVDYGEAARDLLAEPRPEGTVSAYESQSSDRKVLVRPGKRDITVHVNWSAIGRMVREEDWQTVAYTDQFAFLSSFGALQEAVELAQQQATPAAMEQLAVLKDVLLPGGMGETVKVLVASRGLSDDGSWLTLERVRELEPKARGVDCPVG